jgi:hypothetical protein
MSTLPELSIVVDKDKPGGTTSVIDAGGVDVEWDPDTGASGTTQDSVAMMGLDVIALRIAFWDTIASAAHMFDAACIISCSLVALGELTEADAVEELVRVTPFVRGTADYTATLDLDRSAVTDALGSAASISCVLDIRVETDDLRLSYRVPVTLYRPAIGEQGSDTPVATLWANVNGAQMRQRTDGLIEFYDFALEKWVTPVVRNGVIEFQEDA